MRVVRDRGRDRAFFQSVTLHVPQPYVAGIVMPLDDRDFQNIALGVRRVRKSLVRRNDFAVDKPHNRLFAALKVRGGKRAAMH